MEEKNSDSAKKAWGQATYYQLLLETAMRLPRSQFEQIERLAILLLAELLIENGGGIQWSLTQIREEIGVSEAALVKTLRKLQDPENPFWPFVQVHPKGEGKHISYQLGLVDWIRDAEAQETEPPIDYLSLPIPASLAAVLPEIFAHYLGKTIWEVEQRIGDTVIHVRVSHNATRENDETTRSFPKIDLTSLLLPFTQKDTAV